MRLRCCILLSFLALTAHTVLADVLYNVTNLGSLGGTYTQAYGINDAGQVTGLAMVPYSLPTMDTSFHTFVYSDGRISDLGAIGPFGSQGYGINNAGQVTGDLFVSRGIGNGYLDNNGTVTDLSSGTTVLFGSESSSRGINDAGQVTGYSSSLNGAFIYDHGRTQPLGTLGGDGSFGRAINAAGQVTGSATTVNGASHAFLYSDDAMHDLGVLNGGDDTSEGLAINKPGQVVGSSWIASASNHEAFLYSNGVMLGLGSLTGDDRSQAEGINDVGQIVGQAWNSVNSASAGSAFLYSNGQMLNLNSLIDPSQDISLNDATGINNEGQIIANSLTSAFLLMPVSTSVPEPDTALLLAIGGSVLLLCRNGKGRGGNSREHSE